MLGCPGGGDGLGPAGTGGTGGMAGSGGGGGSARSGGSPDTGGAGGMVGGSGGGGNAAGGSGSAGTGGAGPARGCDTDLTGTWDLISTSAYEAPGSGTLVIGADTLTVTINHRSTSGLDFYRLAYSTQGSRTLSWQGTSEPAISIDVQNTPVALDEGSIPLALGGSWVFSANMVRFSVSVGAVASSLIVDRLSTGTMVGGTWPPRLPRPRLAETYSVSRLSPLASQFGFFGGQWQAVNDKDDKNCSITVENNSVQFDCQTGNAFNGITHLTVGSDCVVSGSTINSGYELSARRR